MFEKFIKEINDEAALHSSTDAKVPTLSQTIAKPPVCVQRSCCCDESRPLDGRSEQPPPSN
jgi:hypothetical protein